MEVSLYQQNFSFSDLVWESWPQYSLLGTTEYSLADLQIQLPLIPLTPLKTSPSSTCYSWNAYPCNWGIHRTLKLYPMIFIYPENSFHSPRFTHTPGSLQIMYMHTSPPCIKDSCFVEDSQRIPSSKRAITLRYWETAFFLLLYPQGSQSQTDLIQKPTPSRLCFILPAWNT